MQRCDDLFFWYVRLAEKWRPKVVVAENVSGLVKGNAKGYVLEIFEAFRGAGYEVQLFRLNSAAMGVPQRRERVFFVARRADLGLPKLSLAFAGKLHTVREAWDGIGPQTGKRLTPELAKWWRATPRGRNFSFAHPKGHLFNWQRLDWDSVAPTVMAFDELCHPDEPRHLSAAENARLQTFPDDYDFYGVKPAEACGRSVPPFMMARLSTEIRRQILLV